MEHTIIHNRFAYYSRTTIGQLLIQGKHFCYTLEDTVRGDGIKVDEETAIPANGVGYLVNTRFSPAFKREMLQLTTDGVDTIEKDGIKFRYVYAHGGNKHEDTEGCVLVAFNREDNKIWGTAEAKLFNKVKPWLDKGDTVTWIVVNNNSII